MDPSYGQLREMDDEQLITSHDRSAKNASLGLSYYLDELRRREADPQTQSMVEATITIERWTKRVTILTAVNVVFSALALLAAVIQ